jgi:prepilin-type N-terminal cleavage/methylation domain-containing protein
LEIEDFRIIGQVNKINRRTNKKETKVESKTGKNKRKAFTIIELLTVMSIIVILFGLLVPSMNMVRRYSKKVKQNAQFHSINTALEMYKNDFEDYPESKAKDGDDTDYCGAMKLCEAMVGQDLLGLHPESVFSATGMASDGSTDLYPNPLNMSNSLHVDNLRSRKGPYLPVDSANAYRLSSIYGATYGAPFASDANMVICDEYPRLRDMGTGKKAGMPVLYYCADITKTGHDKDASPLSLNIYNSEDNQELVDLKLPWEPTSSHPMASSGGTDPEGKATNEAKFYEITRDEKIISMARPMRSDSYILISAGFDGLYGTSDDVFNFGE